MITEEGIVFNIQHFSIHDGPGIRTVVFLKGCPLRCRWCANPESQRPCPEMAWTKQDCIGCGSCVKLLPSLSCRFEEDQLVWDTAAEPDPGEASRVCPSEAFHVIGSSVTVQEVITEVEKDRSFYANSGGGMTVSGGEPMMQPVFLRALLKEAGRHRLHRAIETCGVAAWDVYQSIVWELDTMLTDIKCMDDSLHTEYTGGSNRQILENLQNARRLRPDLPILVRTPVIPGFNDSEEEILRIVSFVKGLKAGYELLKYHQYGLPKYISLNRPYPMGDVTLSEERFRELETLAIRELQKDAAPLPYGAPYAPGLPLELLEGAGI